MAGPARRPPPPGEAMDLPWAYALGHSATTGARRGEGPPRWAAGLDPLETLFLGAAWPEHYGDAYRFANACDTWLRVLRGTPYWAGIVRFAAEALAASRELTGPGAPASQDTGSQHTGDSDTGSRDADDLYAPLRERLEAVRRQARLEWELPWQLLPGQLLRGARCFDGPARDIRLPAPPPDADELIGWFWAVHESSDRDGGGTAFGALTNGLKTLRAAGALGGHRSYGSIGLLKGLYAGLVLPAGQEPPGDLVNRAIAWALGLPPESPLVPVVDVLLIAVERGLELEQTLGHLSGVRAFGRPVEAADREWRSSTGTALRRVARELGS